MVYIVSIITDGPAMLFINLGVVIVAGVFFGRLAEAIKVPAVSGYLVAGLLIGPVTGFINQDEVQSFALISNLALAFIAFQVGNELWFGKLKKTGKKIIIITIVQALMTTLIVTLLSLFFVELSIALVLGAIAAATAPAPIMMIVKKYKAKGELTDTVIPLVGFDDAVGVLLFSILLSLSIAMVNTGSGGVNLGELIGKPLLEILISIVIGVVIGFVAGKVIKAIDTGEDQGEKNLDIIIITIFLTTGVAMLFEASPILTPMIAGAVVTNLINKQAYQVEDRTIRTFIPPLMIVFFTLAGAELQFDIVFAAGVIGVVYIISRIIGKMVGSYIGTTITKSSSKVKQYLGLSLLPQSGVAIGLSVAAFNQISPYSMDNALIIKNVILTSVLFFALLGPVLVKLSLERTGEIKYDQAKPVK